jgi:glycosyltransferase involved in cell wall biosynthesis
VKKILFVGYMPFYESGMMQMYAFANELSRLGHGVLVLVPPDDRYAQALQSVELMGQPPLFRLDEVKFKGPFLNGEIRRQARAFRPDIIHAWTPRHIPASVALQIRRDTSARLIVHCQDSEEYLYGLHLAAIGRRVPWPWLRKLARPPLYLRMLLRPLLWPLRWQVKHPLTYNLVNKAADCFTAHNPPLQRRIQSWFPDKRVELLYTGVDLDRFHPGVSGEPVRCKYGLNGRRVAMYTGTINLPDMVVFLRAVKAARETYPRLVFVYVGGHHRHFADELERAIGEMEMSDAVILTGEVPHKDVHRYMAAADILLQWGTPGPVNDFRLPGKVLEYMAMGKPVITYATGIGEIFEDGGEVLKTYRGDAEEIAGQIERLLSDRELAEQLSRNGRGKVEALFSWEQNTRRLAEIYREVATV